MAHVTRQSIPVVMRLLLAAASKREELKAWDMWLALYPHMVIPSPYTEGGKPPLPFRPFSRFWREQMEPVVTQPELTAEEIIARFEAIKERHQQQGKPT